MTRDEKCRALWAMIEDLSEDELTLTLELFDICAHGTPAQQATMNALLDEWRARK